MGFNLRQKLEETFADINPFDNGATAQTVRANRVKAQPAQTVNKQQIQNRPMFQQNNQPAFTQQKQFKIQTQSPTINVNNSMPKVQTFGQSSDPLKVGQVKTPQIQLQVQPTLQTPKLQPPQQSTLNPQQQVLSSQLQKQPVVNQRPLQVSQPQQPKLYSPVPVSGVSQSTWNAMTPQAQQAMITREKAQKQAQSDVWNPIKIGGDIVHAGGQAAKAAVDLGAGMINDLGNRTADFGEAGATVIGELNGQNKRNEEQIQRYIDEETRMRDSFVNRARNATSQAEFDKYINMARSLNAGISDNTDRLNALRNEALENTDPMKTISNAGMTALDLATLGKGKAILEGTKLSAKVTAPVMQQLMKNTAITGIQGFGIGGTYGGLSTMKDPNATAEDYMKNIGTGALVGGGLGIGAQVALPVAGVAAKQAVKGTESAIVRSANYGLKPPTNLSKDELYIASKVRQAREGYISPQDITVQEAAIYQNIQRKLGAKPGTPDGEMAVVDALGAHRDFETKRAVRKDATLNALEKSSDFTRQHLVPGGTLMGVKAKGFQDAQAKGLVFDGVDGKPRFEVDDSGAKILDDYFDERQLQDVLDHPKLYEQYPELRNMTIVEQPALKDRGARGMYDEANNALAVSPDLLRNPEKLKSTILHELQHAIQKKEGFARGGSLETFTGDETGSRYKEITKALKDLKPKTDAIRSEINQALAVGDMNTVARLSDHPLIKRRGELVREQNDIVINRQRPREAYNNLAGEAEARAVQARRKMSMSERYKDAGGIKVYHGGAGVDTINKDGVKILSPEDKLKYASSGGGYVGLSTSADKNYAQQYSQNIAGHNRVAEISIKKDARILELPEGQSIDDMSANELSGLSKKYDVIKSVEDNEYRILNEGAVASNRESTFYDSLDVPKEDLIIRNDGGKAMSIEPKPKRTAKQVDAELKVMSDSPEFQEFYNGGKITGKSWNEYQRLSKEYRQLLDGAKDQPAGSMKPSKRDLRDYAKMLNDDEASQKAIGTQGLQNSKSAQRQSQGKRIHPTNQGTSSRSSQQSGRQNPLPDNKARTGRTYPDNTPDIDTAQYVKDMGRSQKSAMQSESGFKAKSADFKEKFIDDLSPIEDRLNKAIKDGASVDVKDHITYQLDRSRRAEGVMNAYVRDNGLDKIIQNVDNVDEFDQYLIARHAKELDEDVLTGRDIAKDAALVRQLEGKYGEKAKELYAYNQKLLDTSVDYGLISKESAAALKKQYPDYVPFNRIFNEDELANLYGGAGKGDASLSSQNVVKKIKGSNRAIASPLNSIIDKTRVVVEQGERNRAAQMLANYRELPGNPYNLKEIPKNETIGTRHTISYLDKGVKRTFETDKVIADAAKNMTRQEIGLWGRIAAVPARVLRGGATTVNIGFAGANVVKDVIGAAINSKHPFRIADPKAFGKALSAALEHDGPYYQELMREGVAGTSFDMYRNPLKSNIGEIRSHKNLGTRAAYNVTHPSQWYRTLENTIGRSEDFGRALQYYSNKSGFEAKLGKGSKDAKTLAADQARHNSTNFFRHGSAGKGINLAIPYWNAGVQGARIQTRRIAERPVQTVAKIGFAIAAPSAMIAMNNYSTPERQEIMDNIQDYEKEGNIIILGANPHMNQETGKWEDVYKIPVPPQHIGIHTAVQDAVRSAKTGEGFDVLKNLGKITQNYTTVNPTNLRETASSYTPQALKLVAEPMTNTNFFTGNPIVPESQKNLPAKDQFGDYTSGTAKILGGVTNISPRQIDNAIRTGTGGAGQNALWASDKMLAGAGAIEAKDVKGQDPLTSITRRFSGAASVSASDKAENLFKKYKEQVVQTNEYKNASQYDRQRMLNRLQNDLSAVEWDKTGKSEKNLTGKQKALKSDGFDPSVYTNLDSKTANKGTPKEKYDQTLKDYNDNKANMSEVQRFKKEKELATLKVKSNFDKDVVDLWGMSKADIYGLLTKDKDGNRKANELIKLDQAMYDAGLTKYLTFKNGIAPAQRGGTKRASTGRKGTGSRGGRARSAKGKFDYKLFGFSGSGGTSNSKQLHDLLKRAQLKVQK